MLIPEQQLRRLSDRALLKRRVGEVCHSISGTYIDRQLAGLEQDLWQAGIHHLPIEVYLGDEWFTPDGSSAIAIPFYLTRPRLRELERRQMGYVEGGTPLHCRKLLRHEAGHAFDHAYGISARRDFQRLFGQPKTYQTGRYHYDKGSQDFVSHLEDGYGQSHPFEDFAETFAVCLDPDMPWQLLYENRPKALAKLHYVDQLITRFGGRKPRYPLLHNYPYSAHRMRITLERYYKKRKPQVGIPRSG